MALIENIDSLLGYKNLYIAKFNALYIKNIRLLKQDFRKFVVRATRIRKVKLGLDAASSRTLDSNSTSTAGKNISVMQQENKAPS